MPSSSESTHRWNKLEVGFNFIDPPHTHCQRGSDSHARDDVTLVICPLLQSGGHDIKEKNPTVLLPSSYPTTTMLPLRSATKTITRAAVRSSSPIYLDGTRTNCIRSGNSPVDSLRQFLPPNPDPEHRPLRVPRTPYSMSALPPRD